MQVGHVVGSCRSRIAGCLDCLLYLSFVERSKVRVTFVSFVNFSVDFAGDGVLSVGSDTCEVFGEALGYCRGFGIWFAVEVNRLVTLRVSAFARKGTEEAKGFGWIVGVVAAGHMFCPCLEGFVLRTLSNLSV